MSPQGRTTSPNDHSPDIDGLRGIAVIAVIINHFNANLLPSGFLGVDIFFVISGYVITSSLLGRSAATLTAFLSAFYVRRVKRLVPALLLCVGVTSLLICLFDPSPSASLRTGIAATFGLSNFYLIRQATDYFGNSAQLNAFTHTWSLGVEEQFYAVFPLIAWFTINRRRLSPSKQFLWIMSGLTLASLIAFHILSEFNGPASFYLMPTRLWELGIGAISFVLLRDGSPAWFVKLGKHGMSFVLLLMMATLFASHDYSIYLTEVIVLLTAILLGLARTQTGNHGALAHPVMVYLGRISYSLYLWHWSVLVLSRWTVGVHAWTAPIQILIIVGLAAATYHYIENPLRVARWSEKPITSISYGVLGMTATAGFLLVFLKPLYGRMYLGDPPPMVASGTESLLDDYSLPDGSSTWIARKCVISNDQDRKHIGIKACTLGHFSAAEKRVLVAGNSFSAALAGAFDQLVLLDRYAVTITSSWGASPVMELPSEGPWKNASEYYWRQIIPQLISKLRAGDWMFLVSDLSEFSPEVQSGKSSSRLKQFIQGLEVLADDLRRRDVNLAVLHGIPFAREANCEPASAMPQWFAPLGGPCHFLSRAETLARRAELDRVLSELRMRKKLMVVDLMNIFCPGVTCGYTSKDGSMLYRDVFSHPSVEAAKLSAPKVREALITYPQYSVASQRAHASE